MKRHELIIIGAGPAGLSAAIEAASHGMQVVVYDENSRPGGQLFKQIHKFFGSKEHRAKTRGFNIGNMLLAEARQLGVEVVLNAAVMGIFDNKTVSVMIDGTVNHVKANNIIVATGASENMISFPGWTLPGVIGAGAAQTMMNLHGLRPGSKILMVGSGNVGLVVSYQLIQAGCEMVALIDAAPQVGGYGVHAAKITRLGVPFFMSHTVKEVSGYDQVESATIVAVDQNWQPVPGSEKKLEVDTICLAVGLSPMSQLCRMAGCQMEEKAARGGFVPVCNEYGETSITGVFVAGDVSGIEEASSAMLEGRIAGLTAACQQSYLDQAQFNLSYEHYKKSLDQLRGGTFGSHDQDATGSSGTDEGCLLSLSLLSCGYLSDIDAEHYPGIPSDAKRVQGITPVIECTQNIPCDPCQDACPKGCIKVNGAITSIPALEESAVCSGCGMCVAACPGQAIFVVNESFATGYASVAIPYEFLPLPVKGDKGLALSRSGEELGEAEVVGISLAKAMDKTAVLTMKVPLAWSMQARAFRPVKEVCI